MNWTSKDGGRGNLPRESWEPDGLAAPRDRNPRRQPTKEELDRRQKRRAATREANERLRALAERLKADVDRRVAQAPAKAARPARPPASSPRNSTTGGGVGRPVVSHAVTRTVLTPRGERRTTTKQIVVRLPPSSKDEAKAVRSAWHQTLVACHVKDAQLAHVMGDGAVVSRPSVKVPPVSPTRRPKAAARLLDEFEALVEAVSAQAARARRVLAAGGATAKLAEFAADAEPLTTAFEDALARRLAARWPRAAGRG